MHLADERPFRRINSPVGSEANLASGSTWLFGHSRLGRSAGEVVEGVAALGDDRELGGDTVGLVVMTVANRELARSAKCSAADRKRPAGTAELSVPSDGVSVSFFMRLTIDHSVL